MLAKSLQSKTLCDPMDYSLTGSCARGILQVRILEWVAMPFSRAPSRPKDWTCGSHISCLAGDFPGSSDGKASAYNAGDLVRSLGWEDPLEKEMATHSSILAWKIPWTEEPGRLQSIGLQRVEHDWATSLSLFTFMHWRRKWQPTPVFLPGESQGQGSLVGCSPWGRKELDTTERFHFTSVRTGLLSDIIGA